MAPLAAMDNGYQASLESFKANQHKAYKGLCLAIMQAGPAPGPITITASAGELKVLLPPFKLFDKITAEAIAV